MQNKKKFRLILDIIMLIIMFLMMAYSLIGERFHEILGTVIIILFIIHHINNRGWYRSFKTSMHSPVNIFRNIIDVLLLIFMVCQPVSGILMSKHIYTFLHIDGISAFTREIHLPLAYWGFVLLGIHIGFHMYPLFKKIRGKNKAGGTFVAVIFILISIYGCFALIKRQFAEYMFKITNFAFYDMNEARVLFFLDYIAVMILLVVIGVAVTAGLSKISLKK